MLTPTPLAKVFARFRVSWAVAEGCDLPATQPHLVNSMHNFTPLSAAIGGTLVGLAVALLMLTTGRIAGISGIVHGLISNAGGKSWRPAFVAGLVLAPLIAKLVGFTMPMPQIPASWVVTAGAGLLVGFGTRLGGGCTSGHGVCGIARLSLRSIAATLIFMGTAMVVVAIVRHGPAG